MTSRKAVLAAAMATLLWSGPGHAQGFARTPAPEGAQAYIQSPRDGATVPSRFVVRFGLRNMGVATAGVSKADVGHHHLLIDTELPPAGQPIPNDDKHLHFGNGHTEARITLPPGRHTLQLLMGDHDHVPHDPPVASKRITVIVAPAK